MPRLLLPLGLLGVVALVLAGCGPTPATRPTTSTPTPSPASGALHPVGAPVELATGLTSPWSIVRLADGTVLVSERDTAVVQQVLPDGTLRQIGTVPGVASADEGGLLGLAVLESEEERWLYAYLTAPADNRIVRIPLTSDLRMGEPEVILEGLAKAGNHNGGRIAFGPDGMLYATVGDANNPPSAQDVASPNGKILRLTPEGDVPSDNPFPDSYVYSLGHRNPQGIAWDDDDQLWAAEFGQDTWDEFNRIVPGGNYGWPDVEGQGGPPGYEQPLLQWPTSDASPSGLAYIDGTFFLASLRGQRIWSISVAADGSASTFAWFVGEYGRIRDVAAGPDGSLWFLTNNTDGRGDPGPSDDRLLEVELEHVPTPGEG